MEQMDAFTRETELNVSILQIAAEHADQLDVCGVSFLELLEDTYLDFARVTILGDSANDLDRYSVLCLNVDCFYHFAEGSLTKKANRAI